MRETQKVQPQPGDEIKTLPLESAVVVQLKRNLLEAKVNISEIRPVASVLRGAPSKLDLHEKRTSGFKLPPEVVFPPNANLQHPCTLLLDTGTKQTDTIRLVKNKFFIQITYNQHLKNVYVFFCVIMCDLI